MNRAYPISLAVFAFIVIFAVFAFYDQAFADATAATSPGTMADDNSIGTTAWTNVDNAKVSDNVYSDAATGGTNVLENSVKLVKGGVISGNDNSTGVSIGAEAYVSYGSASDLWGLTLTPADVNASDFGAVFGMKNNAGVISHYLKATNFGFSIPSDATINGVLLEVERKGTTCASTCVRVDHMRITVTYTPAAPAQHSAVTFGSGTTVINQGTLIIP